MRKKFLNIVLTRKNACFSEKKWTFNKIGIGSSRYFSTRCKQITCIRLKFSYHMITTHTSQRILYNCIILKCLLDFDNNSKPSFFNISFNWVKGKVHKFFLKGFHKVILHSVTMLDITYMWDMWVSLHIFTEN